MHLWLKSDFDALDFVVFTQASNGSASSDADAFQIVSGCAHLLAIADICALTLLDVQWNGHRILGPGKIIC